MWLNLIYDVIHIAQTSYGLLEYQGVKNFTLVAGLIFPGLHTWVSSAQRDASVHELMCYLHNSHLSFNRSDQHNQCKPNRWLYWATNEMPTVVKTSNYLSAHQLVWYNVHRYYQLLWYQSMSTIKHDIWISQNINPSLVNIASFAIGFHWLNPSTYS